MAHSHDCVKRKLWLYAIMTSERKPQTQDKFILRLPDGMRDRIKAAAEANNRSMNSEILAALDEKFPPPFSRQETMRMIKASLIMFADDKAGLREGTAAKNEAFALLVIEKILGEKNPGHLLDEIEAASIDISDVSINRFVEWQNEMLARLQD
ncbi:Arc family DNA-binding protein [Xinfangfangia pollutisoli]|uniref:Arc family DNA-binding protein n=1 Tax=Xinfangfangia pollutisoli TaxID=2865960 RepID=UPI001CD4143C|nr:Arc family DNA-binding protein [Xinfangfangia pollutisoli]